MTDFIHLVNHIKNVSNSKYPIVQRESLFILEDLIENNKAIHVLLKGLGELDNDEAIEILNKFGSLPDHVNVVYERNTPKLAIEMFFKILIDDMFLFAHVNDSEKFLSLIGNILGIYFSKGYSVMVCEYLNTKFEIKPKSIVVFSKLLNHISLKYFDNVLSNIIVLIKSNNCVKYICENIFNPILLPKIIFICQKMIFFQFFETDFVVTNVSLLVNRLSSDQQKSILQEILILWSDEKSINNISFNQHFYLSKMLLLIFFQFEQSAKKNFFLGDNLSFILKGIYVHLGQEIRPYQLVGMVIAELLSSYCSYKSVDSLKFEYEETNETKILKQLVNLDRTSTTVIESEKKENDFSNNIEIESDEDDFQPIESIFDDDKTPMKRPYYVRDCFEGLSNTKPENSDYFMICLDSVENLISICPEASIEESLEFSRTLLHLHLEFEVEKFTEKQRSALVALCCLDPVRVSRYLIGEFFSEHNSLGVRYNILHVITRTAQKLSGFNEDLQSSNQSMFTIDLPLTTKIEDKQSKKACRKTRYFFKKRRQAAEIPNLLNDYSKHLFFPLLAGGQQFETFEKDFGLLSRYVYTLAIVVHCSAHCVGFGEMLKEYCLFLQSLRSHSELIVKIAVQVSFGISLIGLNGASEACIDEMFEQLLEWQTWLMSEFNKAKFDLNDDFSSLIEKNMFLMKDLVLNVTNSLLPNK